MELIKNPASVKGLAKEIKKACNLYWSRKIDEDELREIVCYWAKYQGEKLFKGREYNPTIKKIIGKKRIKLLNIMLEGFQIRL